MILSHFWRRWRKEYLLSLRDCHCYSKGVDVKKKLSPGYVVIMYDNSSQRGFWRLARIEKLMEGVDGQARGAVIRVPSRGEKKTAVLRCPVTHLYPLEIEGAEDNVDGNTESVSSVKPTMLSNLKPAGDPQPQSRPPRRAAERARQWM